MNKSQAVQKGNDLLRRMKGTGWTLSVWENFGWHYCVQKGWMKVYSSYGGGDRFTCLFGEGGGNPIWTDKHAYYDDPNDAVEAQLRLAQEVVSTYQREINRISR